MTGANKDRCELYRSILEGKACVHPATVFDPLSAVLAEEAGFKAGMLAGSIAALTVLGAPDIVLLTLSEFADTARRITRASSFPVMVDGDHGYGNALNVMRTVEELETAGIAAVSIEDTVLPQPYGVRGETFISIDEGVGKMRAALAARRNPAFAILGRTTAHRRHGLDESIKRGHAYAKAGVDALFFPALSGPDDVDRLAEASFGRPMIVSGLAPDAVTLDWLAARGARLALPGHQPFYAALKAVQGAFAALAGTSSYKGVALPSSAEVARWTGETRWGGAGGDYLGGGGKSA